MSDEKVNGDDLQREPDECDECEVLRRELAEARAEAQICREAFSRLRDLCVANGYQVVPHLQAFEPLKATMESLDGMKREIARRLNGSYNRRK